MKKKYVKKLRGHERKKIKTTFEDHLLFGRKKRNRMVAKRNIGHHAAVYTRESYLKADLWK